MKNIYKIIAILTAAFTCDAAFAQVTNPSENPQYVGDIPRPELNSDWKVSVGGGTIYSPKFVGSKDNNFKVIPDVRVDYKDIVFANFQEGLGYNFRPDSAWRLGPLAKIDFGRPEDGGSIFSIGDKSDELRGMGDVDPTLELGGFVEYKFLESLATKFELRHGVGGHDGLVGDINLNYMTRAGEVILTFGPRMKFADDNYINSYFGISSTQSAATGFSKYNAGGGVFSYGVGGAAIMPLTDKFTLTGFIGYDRLGSEVEDSPLVEKRGDPNQAVVGTTLSYDLGL